MNLSDARDVSFAFGILDTLVRQRNNNEGFPVRLPEGWRYDVDSNEFMLMAFEPEEATSPAETTKLYFKHRDTRNYLYVVKENNEWKLKIPATSQAFALGYFNKF